MKAGAAAGLVFGLLLGLAGCGSPAVTKAVVCQVAPTYALDAMLSVMVDQGYSVLNVDEVNRSIEACNAPSGVAALSSRTEPCRISVVLLSGAEGPGLYWRRSVRRGLTTRMTITVTHRGDSDNVDQEAMIGELIKGFEARVGQPVEVLPDQSDNQGTPPEIRVKSPAANREPGNR